MQRNSDRRGNWATRIIVGVVALGALIVGPRLYVSATATPVHPRPEGAPSVTQAEPSPQWSEAVDRARRRLRAGLSDQNLPGLSVAVGAGGDIVWAEGFGWADIKQRTPVTPQMRFRMTTASPVLTSAAVGLLVERGRLTLDDEIQTYVPQFPKKQWPVTLRQLMGHVAGLTTDSPERPLSYRRCEQPIEALPHFAEGDLLFEPGTQFRHSNYGWIPVSAAIEAAAGQPFLTFMQEQIFQPLGMKDTGAESAKEENPDRIGGPEEDPPPFTLIHDLILEPLGISGGNGTRPPQKIATLYVPGFGPKLVIRHGVHASHPRNLSCYAGSMAFFSTPSDLVRFGVAMSAGTLLQPATVQLLQSSQQLASGQATGYGLGWNLGTVTLAGDTTPAAGHHGEWQGGTVASLLTFPERGIVVAVTSNISHADTAALALQVADVFAEQAGWQQLP